MNKEIWDKIYAAGNAAAIAQNAKLGAEGSRGFDCGFAWIVLRPARGAFAKWLETHDAAGNATTAEHSHAGGRPIAGKHHAGGLSIWYSKLHSVNTQSVSVHEAAVRAAAEVMRAEFPASYRISTDSRLD